MYLTQPSMCVTEALDTNSNKSAILACNKVLKKQPNNFLVKARGCLCVSVHPHNLSAS